MNINEQIEATKLSDNELKNDVKQNLENFADQQDVPPDTAPEDVAATLCHLYMPKFQILVNKLSKKALQRLIYNLIQFPLENENYKPKTEEEKNAFLIGDRLLTSKYMMLIFSFSQNEALNNIVEEKTLDNTNNAVVESTGNEGENK